MKEKAAWRGQGTARNGDAEETPLSENKVRTKGIHSSLGLWVFFPAEKECSLLTENVSDKKSENRPGVPGCARRTNL